MKRALCPYCKEEIKADAMICKHCHERLYRSPRELVMAVALERIRMVVTSSIIPSVDPCGALCYAKFSHSKPALNECLDNCKAAEAVALVAEKLHREFVAILADIVWGKGDIDPIPLERAIRERFSQPHVP